MNKFLAILLSLFSISCAAGPENTGEQAVFQSKELNKLIRDFKGTEGFEIVQFGSLGTNTVASFLNLANTDDDKDLQTVSALLRSVKNVTIVEYDDSSDEHKADFSSRIDELLKNHELIMGVKDGGDRLKIFGVLDEKARKLNDVIIFDASDCTVISLLGSVPMEVIDSLIRK